MGEGALRAIFGSSSFVALAIALGLTAVLALPAAAAQSTLPGMDVSHHNGDIDWTKVKGDGTKFVVAKVTEGTGFLDDHYASNKQQAESVGIAFGAYHFANPSSGAGDAVAEADWFVANARLTGKNLVPVLDLELSGGLGAKKLKRWTKAWLAEVQSQLGVKPIIYSTPAFWRERLANTRWFADNGYRLWVAHWTSASQPSVPASNWGGRGWTLWQYTNCGSVSGVVGCVDEDRYAGSGMAALKIKNNR
jgi:GH25 family lysozyme M1 (1,4-beta-N-acetylmuramidase)